MEERNRDNDVENRNRESRNENQEKPSSVLQMPAFERARNLFLRRAESNGDESNRLASPQERARPFLMAQTSVANNRINHWVQNVQFGSMEDDDDGSDEEELSSSASEFLPLHHTRVQRLIHWPPPTMGPSMRPGPKNHRRSRSYSTGREPHPPSTGVLENLEEGEIRLTPGLLGWGSPAQTNSSTAATITLSELGGEQDRGSSTTENHEYVSETLTGGETYHDLLKSFLSTTPEDLSDLELSSPRLILSRGGLRIAKSVSRLGWQLAGTQTHLTEVVFEALKSNEDPSEADETLLKLFFLLFGKLKEAKQQSGESEIQTMLDTATNPDSSNNESERCFFAWPVVEMAEYEFGGNADDVNFEHVVVILDFPVLSVESQSYLEVLLEGPFLSQLGKVKTVHIPTDVTDEQRSKGFVFVEMTTEKECDNVVKAVQNFIWGPNHKLQARHFRGFGTEKEASVAEDKSSENEDIVDSLAKTAPVGAVAEEMSKLEELQIDDIKEDAASVSPVFRPCHIKSWLKTRLGVATEAVASMRGGTLGESLGHLEMELEAAVTKLDVHELFELDEKVTGQYKGAVPNAFSSHRALMTMINGSGLRLLKEEDEQTNDLDSQEDEKMTERQLWRQCLGSERFRSAALLRRLRVAEAQWSMLSREAKERLQFISHLEQQMDTTSQQLRHEQVVKESLRMRIQEQEAYITQQEGHFQEKMRDTIVRIRETMAQAHAREMQDLREKMRHLERAKKTKRASKPNIMEELPFLLNQEDLEEMDEESLTAIEESLERSVADVRRAKEECIRRQKARMEEKENSASDALCCICIDNPKTVVLLPCKHLCVCETCSENTRLRKCPICRVRIRDTLSVYS